MTELKSRIYLMIAFGPANSRMWNYVASCGGNPETAAKKLISGDLSGVFPQDLKYVKNATEEKAEKLIEFCDEKGIGMCCFDSPEYPSRLKTIYNPPAVLFYLGNIEPLEEKIMIASVGTRRPSEYSVRISGRICSELAKAGVGLASGLAVGLDELSLTSAVSVGGYVCSVLPCGLGYDYPPGYSSVRSEIASKGCLITEYPPGTKPNSLSFRARNRILAGISSGALILQAGETSGALSTASFALSQGRDIFCIPPHDIYSPDYLGNAELIRAGATPVFGISDILDSYRRSHPHIFTAEEHDEPQKPKPRQPSKPKTSSRPVAPGVEDMIKTPSVPPRELEGVKLDIYNAIKSGGSVHLDELSVGIADIFELEAYLTELELDGLIKSLPGNRFSAI